MSDRKEDRKLLSYKCGWCKDDILYAKDETPPNPCPNCGWTHLERKYDDVPSEIKLDLNNL